MSNLMTALRDQTSEADLDRLRATRKLLDESLNEAPFVKVRDLESLYSANYRFGYGDLILTVAKNRLEFDGATVKLESYELVGSAIDEYLAHKPTPPTVVPHTVIELDNRGFLHTLNPHGTYQPDAVVRLAVEAGLNHSIIELTLDELQFVTDFISVVDISIDLDYLKEVADVIDTNQRLTASNGDMHAVCYAHSRDVDKRLVGFRIGEKTFEIPMPSNNVAKLAASSMATTLARFK